LDAPDARRAHAALSEVKAALDLRAALQLVAQSGRELPDTRDAAAWLQALVDALCELSSRDPLTGLANRRQFELALVRELGRVARSGDPSLLLTLDIDHFKRVNDTHGHAAGDAVLKAVAARLLECVRPMDTVARVGGEEFAIVLPHCSPSFGPAVAERIRRRVESQRVALPDGSEITVTVSLGGAFAPPWVHSSPALWLERADQQLYRAKAEGRNGACFEPVAQAEVSAEERGMLFSAPMPLQEPE
jgi:diguanylate cyclase (GGDEF)-like protein